MCCNFYSLSLYSNGDNFIDWKELKSALLGFEVNPKVEDWEVDELFKDADKNGDGSIDVEGMNERLLLKCNYIISCLSSLVTVLVK